MELSFVCLDLASWLFALYFLFSFSGLLVARCWRSLKIQRWRALRGVLICTHSRLTDGVSQGDSRQVIDVVVHRVRIRAIQVPGKGGYLLAGNRSEGGWAAVELII